MRRLTRIILASLGFVAAIASAAENQGLPVLKFDITQFVVQGNTLLQPERIEQILAPFTGKQKDFSDVQRALEALQKAYRDLGYGAVQVTLPEQELKQGAVRFKVIEARIRAIGIQGNEHHDDRNIRRSVPDLKEGEAPNARDVAASLRVANENSSKQTTVLLRAAEVEDEIDATVKVTDDKPWKVFAIGDNTGNRDTGIYRVGVGFQHSNLFNLDHIFTFQYLTSPEKADKVKIAGASYRIPIYPWGDSLDLIAGYSNVNSGTLQNLFNVSGSGTVYGIRYNHYLPRVREIYDHNVYYGLDYKAFKNNVTTTAGGGSTLVPDITVHPASIGYNGQWTFKSSQLNFNASYSQNIPGGNDGGSGDFQKARAGAIADYHIFRYGVSGLKTFANDIQLLSSFYGQYTPDALIPGEQFGLGGFDNVRGFNERELADDKGYRGTVEAYTPDFGGKLINGTRVRLLAFYNFGQVSRNRPQPGEVQRQFISSVGLGLRVGRSGKFGGFSLRADVAQVLNPGGLEFRHSKRAHIGVVYVY